MSENNKINETKEIPRILLVDDEEQFRSAMKKQLEVRGYDVLDVNNGEDAIKIVRHKKPEVVILDQKMPGMDGIQTLKELKKISPEVQVIMLTGYGSTDSARITGKYDVFHYLQKPCGVEELIDIIEAARQERIYAMARHEIPEIKKGSLKEWLIGAHNARPGFIILGAILFALIAFTPPSQHLIDLLNTPKKVEGSSKIAGYAEYKSMKEGQTIAEYYSQRAQIYEKKVNPDGTVEKVPLSPQKAAFKAKVMLGVLVVAALFWATGAIPVGITALLVGVIMYFFEVFPPERVAQAYAKDEVIFIFGVLSISLALTKTGLDRRIGLLLLGSSKSLLRFAFIFSPLLAMAASFLSEHALVAFLAPVFILVYGAAVRAAGIRKDKSLAVMLLLMMSFAANVGGPGSPAAGGRNAIMVGILRDYGITLSFGEWVKYGMPFVPVAALVVAAYFYLVVGRKVLVKDIDVSAHVRREAERIGKMTKNEYRTAVVLVLLIFLWIAFSDKYGMGGPAILCIVLLNIMGILRWRDINQIHWDVVALYASACAMGKGLASTGAALWMADSLVGALPSFMQQGYGLAIASSIFSGFITNFMSDGATVAAIGPITVPMATISGTPPIMVGLATAFSSSFAFMLIIGTPNNAIAYAMAKDPETGEQLVTFGDFLKHGTVVLILSWLVLWFWTILGYWQWLKF